MSELSSDTPEFVITIELMSEPESLCLILTQVLTGVAQYLLEVAHCPAQHKQNTIKQTALLSLLSSLPYTQVMPVSEWWNSCHPAL